MGRFLSGGSLTELSPGSSPEAAPGDEVDLFIIGGGINGAGIARDAAGRGLSVVLVERDDLASGTSWASSKLVHGGLRYLEHYKFRLVREGLAEREVLLRIAPHLVRPLRFVMPYQPALRPAWMIRLGLFLYDRIGGRSSLPDSESVDLASQWGAGLKPIFRRGFAYSDCRVDDARLVILNARDAARNGARILTRTTCLKARRDGTRWQVATEDRRSGARRNFRARAVVNAAGPWVGEVAERVAGVASHDRVRLIKGSHVVVPRLYQGEQAYLLQSPDRRIVFIIPFEERFSLIGTTEIAVDGVSGTLSISPAETLYLRRVVAGFLERGFEDSDVVWSYAGVRALYDDGSKDLSAVTRDYVLELDGGKATPPLLSVFGGKITTYRRLAEHALDKLRPTFPGMKAAWTAGGTLPGGDVGSGGMLQFIARLVATRPDLPSDLLRRLARRHGSEVETLLGSARGTADLGRHFGGLLYEREVEYFIRHEWACSVEDIIWRRSKSGLHMPQEGIAALADFLARQRGALASPPATAETR
jgi:glycerol-3-phosphate dehydrogenase